MDWSLILLGTTFAAGSLAGLARPEKDVSSVDGWRSRLDELQSGAAEDYVGEKRQLEAYPPPKHATIGKVRAISAIGLICGLVLIGVGIFG